MLDPWVAAVDEDFSGGDVIGEDSAAGFDGVFAVDGFLIDDDGAFCNEACDVSKIGSGGGDG